MALYELSDEQRAATLEIIGGAMVPGRAAALVVSIQRALSTPTVVVGQESQESQESIEAGDTESGE